MRWPLAFASAALTFMGVAFMGVAFSPAARADSVIMWNQQLISAIQQTSALMVDGPPEVAREMSIVGTAMYDAAVAANNTGGSASVDAAALAAGYTAMQGIFANSIWSGTGGSAAIQTKVLSSINAAYVGALNSMGITQSGPNPDLSSCIGNSGAACAGLSLGQTAGNSNLTKAGYTVGNNSAGATDGSSAAIINGLANNAPVGSGSVKGVYIPPSNRPEMYPTWGTVTPAGLTSAQVTAAVNSVSGPPSITSTAYADALLQTQCLGSSGATPSAACAAAGFVYGPSSSIAALQGISKTEAQTAALFWNDPGSTLQPPAHWLQIADTVAQGKGLSVVQEAQMSALLGQAEFDAGIAAWTIKYQDNLWRPTTAINDCSNWSGGTYNNCQPGWSSLIATPPHPDYVAGHPAFSAAAADVLANFFGNDNIAFSSTSDAYCNGGTPWRGGSGLVVACTVGGSSSFAYNGGNTFYGSLADCTDAGGTTGISGSDNTCTLNSVAYTFNPGVSASGCNDIPNGGSNDSPLICPITENYTSFTDASAGSLGSELSRIYGGIHTPFAVSDGAVVGLAIGQKLSIEAGIPEPATLGVLSSALIGLLSTRRRFKTRRSTR